MGTISSAQHCIISVTVAAEANTGVEHLQELFPFRQLSNIWGQFSMAISGELPWKYCWFEPFSFLPAACLQSAPLKVDPGSCQPWAGLWLQACPVQRLRPFVDLGGLRGQLRSYTVKPPLPGSSLCQLHLLSPAPSPAPSPICSYLRPWYIAEHYKTCFPLSQQGGLCVVLSFTICAFLHFFFPELSTHIALQLRAIRLQAIAKDQLLLGRLLSSQISRILAFKCRKFTLNFPAPCLKV